MQSKPGGYIDDRSVMHPNGESRAIGGWNPAAEKNDFKLTLNFSSSTSCKIAVYSFLQMNPQVHLGNYGREFDIKVTDLNGERTFYVHNNLNSIYCVFDVEPDAQDKVVIDFIGYYAEPIGAMPPSVSGIYFDPHAPRVTKFEYTDENYPKKVTKTTDAFDNYDETQYNEDGTVKQVTNKRGKTTKYTYTYAPNGNPLITCVEDPLGNKTWTNYDDEWRVISTVDARGSGPDDEDHMTKYEYDENGNQISVTDPLGNKTTYKYDSDGTLISSTDPAGWISYYDIETDVTEEKDALGRVISSTDEDGNTTYYEYDADGNLVKTTNPDGDISTILRVI
ncbi:MAG: hypothetical protein K8T10_03355 [Candidatus Eremiobacteraeota bacterium]|nr:hypothetical protein [Candidatus Eremiobacteraeota bacterium]